MKHILLFIVFIASAFAATAQGHRFADTTSQWNLLFYEPGWFPQTPPSYSIHIANVISDTTIDGTAYQQIGDAFFTRDANDDIYAITYNGYKGKVYSFGAAVGDTIYNIQRQYNLQDTFDCVVDNIEFINWRYLRKKLYVTCYRESNQGAQGFADEWVDGVGTIKYNPLSLEVSQLMIQTGSASLQCYFEDSVQYYHNYSLVDTCAGSTFTSVEEIKHLSASIYPNPTADELTITLSQYPQPNTIILISDCVGRTVGQEALTTSTQQIEVANLPNGMYTYAIMQQGTRHASGKLIIAK